MHIVKYYIIKDSIIFVFLFFQEFSRKISHMIHMTIYCCTHIYHKKMKTHFTYTSFPIFLIKEPLTGSLHYTYIILRMIPIFHNKIEEKNNYIYCLHAASFALVDNFEMPNKTFANLLFLL